MSADYDYEAVHAERYRLSREFIAPLIEPRMRVLSVGDPGSFEHQLQNRLHPEVPNQPCPIQGVVHALAHDLRYPFDAQLRRGSYDLALCMEVLEHIHDQDAERPTEWRATGTGNMLSQLYEMLKPGGHLFLTTPNACSLNAAFKVMTLQAPMVYRPHVREYTPNEVVRMLEDAGFKIARLDTFDPWGGNCYSKPLKELAEKYFPSPHRGEDIFVLAQKPGQV